MIKRGRAVRLFRSRVHSVERSANLLFVCWYHGFEVLLSPSLLVVVDAVVLLGETMEEAERVTYGTEHKTLLGFNIP